jgi:thioredoxin-like negative regulator of GroEL
MEEDFIGAVALLQAFGVLRQREYTMRMTLTQPQKKSRRQILEDFVAAKPADAFARYGLAMECANSGDAAAADEHFKALLASHPEYVAGYFQFGQYLAKSGRTEEARSTLSAGIATAQRTGDEHAKSEMEAALAELG